MMRGVQSLFAILLFMLACRGLLLADEVPPPPGEEENPPTEWFDGDPQWAVTVNPDGHHHVAGKCKIIGEENSTYQVLLYLEADPDLFGAEKVQLMAFAHAVTDPVFGLDTVTVEVDTGGPAGVDTADTFYLAYVLLQRHGYNIEWKGPYVIGPEPPPGGGP